MMYNQYRSNEYRQQDVMGATPLRLVIMAYDLAIAACEKKEFARATETVSALRDALNFDYGETPLGLFRLYQWCLDCIRREDYASAEQVLKELREAWMAAEKKYIPRPEASAASRVAYASAAA